MPVLRIKITAISGGKGTYEKTSGPGFVHTNGDIELGKAKKAVDLEWTVTAAGYTFKDPGFTAATIQQFSNITNSGANKTCTAEDKDEALASKYTLYLEDGAGANVTLDPRVINRES